MCIRDSPLTNAEYRLFIRAGGYEDESWWDTEAARQWRRGEGSAEGQRLNYRGIREQLDQLSDDRIRALSNLTPEQVDWYLWFKHLEPAALERQLEKWFPEGVVYRQPGYWDDSRFNHPARPVVGLTWFEARAYGCWLSAQTGDAYGLPTEADVIVVGSHERNWFVRMFSDSVAKDVLRDAPVPVLVVR